MVKDTGPTGNTDITRALDAVASAIQNAPPSVISATTRNELAHYLMQEFVPRLKNGDLTGWESGACTIPLTVKDGTLAFTKIGVVKSDHRAASMASGPTYP